MLLRLACLSQVTQSQSQRVMRPAVFGEQLYRFSEMRGGGGEFAGGDIDPAQTVMRLRAGGVLLDDGLVKRPALKPLPHGQQGVGEAESRREIIGTPARGFVEKSRRFTMFAYRALNNPEVIDPTKFIRRQ